jgi:hypothetical protein
MAYKVVPFNAQIQAGEGSDRAASQLEQLVNQYEGSGWVFHGLETIDTVIVTPAVPGSNGCLGIGAVPGSPEHRTSVPAYVAVFRQQ